MCLSPIWIKNPKKFIPREGGTKYLLQVKCGKCSECVESKKEEAMMRSYYECLDTFKNSGYVYFDTLTYDRKHLPKLSDFTDKVKRGSKEDFSCYNTEHIRLFLVRLRRFAEYYENSLKENLKYFVTSEYGSRKEYVDERGRKRKGTERPHYHILFFVKNNAISVYKLSMLVDLAWGYGRTDGLKYKGRKYVDEHTYTAESSTEDVKLKVCKYVSKYVGKEMGYTEMINKRVAKLNLEGEEMERIIKIMSNFYRWSNGFGLYGLEYNSEKDIWDGKMRIPDEKKIWKEMPLSKYLERKRFCRCVDGTWELTEEGIERKIAMQKKIVNQTARDFEEFIANLWQYVKKGGGNSKDYIYYRDRIKELMCGRSSKELAYYLVQVQGRLMSEECKKWNERGYMVFHNIENLIESDLLQERQVKDRRNYYTNFAHKKYRDILGNAIIAKGDICHIVEKWEKHCKGMGMDFFTWFQEEKGKLNKQTLDLFGIRDIEIETADSFAKSMCLSEGADIHWWGFDKVKLIWDEVMKPINDIKERTYYEEIKMRRRQKELKSQ